MNDLLAFAIDSHGGIDRWSAFTKLKAEVSIDGAIWHLKQQPGLLTDKIIELDTHVERLTITPFTAADHRLVFAPNRLVLESADGKAIETRDRPVDAFAGQTIQSPWDKFHVAYFAGEVLWTYLTSPFLYTYPGFKCEEIEPWQENGERWRRLKVTFPENITSTNSGMVLALPRASTRAPAAMGRPICRYGRIICSMSRLAFYGET
jgi:hypothetical protein